MPGRKIYRDQTVLEAATERLDIIFSKFEREEICLSYSAGKDSTALLHLCLDRARAHGKLPLQVMTIDLEASYRSTIEMLEWGMLHPDVQPYWICLPFGYRNSVSMFQPYWVAWDPSEEPNWIRPMPTHGCVINQQNNPFCEFGWFPHMRPSQFYSVFSRYIARQTGRCISLIGNRASESLNRWRVLMANKECFECHRWTTKMSTIPETWNSYPIFDWEVTDIWRYIGENRLPYNSAYDWMYRAGRSVHRMRICQPFGDEQKAGLDLYHKLEPETWFKVVERVSGANTGARYCQQAFMGTGRIELPEGHTWKTYYESLLDSLPVPLAEHFSSMVDVTISNWQQRGKIENSAAIDPMYGDLTPGAPSYMRFCKMILRCDFMGHTLKFSGRKREYDDFSAGSEKPRKRESHRMTETLAKRHQARKDKYKGI